MKHIGFTGTRNGMKAEQRQATSVLLWSHAGDDVALDVAAHHGDCAGADADFHSLCKSFAFWMVGHVPSDAVHRAYCDFDELRAPLPYLQRNRAIVNESGVMIATPAEMQEQQRGGTWSTIRYTRKAGKPLAIVWPDGSVTKERWP